ncbi:MAG: MopE-related protein, partial [Polyangiales bacterium]
MRVLRSPLRCLSAAFIAAVVIATASACQVALRADGEDARCDSDTTVCGPGLTCQGGFCRPCVEEPEVCDGRDNDCNGIIDDGFDKDGDGYSTCGAAGSIDCNDDPARGGKDIHPGVPELCNGYDDNCNGLTDEAPNDCRADQECWTAMGKCTVKDDCRIHGCTKGGCNPSTGQCTDPDCRISKSCMPSEICDSKSGICVHVTDVGEACDAQSQCKTGSSCIDLSVIGVSARNPSICTKACCESAGCPEGMVCRAGTSGASVCVKASDVTVSIGTSAPNTKCSNGDECRSGTCDSNCIDGCCGSITCGSGGTCSFKSDNKFVCRSAVGTKAYNNSCNGDSDCQSGFCYDMGFFGGICSKHCCSSEDCDSL